MAVSAIRSVPSHHWIPPKYTTIYKVELVLSTGTIDITNSLSRIEFEDFATESIGRFDIDIWDPNEDIIHKIQGNELVYYYKDYGTSATTKRFTGRISKPSSRGNRMKLSGQAEPVKFINVPVTMSYEETETTTILKAMIDTYAPGFTYTNVLTSGVNLTVNWTQKPFWECVQELCDAAGFDLYIDCDKDFHYFERGSIINSKDAIVHNYNLIEIEDFNKDLDQIRNRITVIGAEVEGVQEIYTADSNDPNYGVDTDFGVRAEIINDDNVITYTQAKELAEAILSQKMNPPLIGSMKGFLLAEVSPGDKIRLSSPADNIPPALYQTNGYKDIIDVEGGNFSTTLYITKEPRKITHVIRDRIIADNRKNQTSMNPNDLRYTNNIIFDSQQGSLTNLEIIEGVLRLEEGQANGNFVSDSRVLDSNLDKCYLIIKGTKTTGATVQVSSDGGVNYQTLYPNQLTTINIKDTHMVIKITITDTTTEITSLSVQYNME